MIFSLKKFFITMCAFEQSEKGMEVFMLKYPRNMHGGELWAKIEVLENV